MFISKFFQLIVQSKCVPLQKQLHHTTFDWQNTFWLDYKAYFSSNLAEIMYEHENQTLCILKEQRLLIIFVVFFMVFDPSKRLNVIEVERGWLDFARGEVLSVSGAVIETSKAMWPWSDANLTLQVRRVVSPRTNITLRMKYSSAPTKFSRHFCRTPALLKFMP